MCTVTLRCGAGALSLTMNRDERYERAPEEPPRRIPGEPGRPAWLAPFDSLSGGTWIGVNECGVVGCVLNGYEPADEALGGAILVPSRGSIIPSILEEQDGLGRAQLPAALDFSAYPSFTLLVASKDGGEIVRWRRGIGLAREVVSQGLTFLTSSSWNAPEVALRRRQAFDAWRAEGEPELHGLPTFHVVTRPGDEGVAPFMTRDVSATRSITSVQVDASRGLTSLTWWPRGHVTAIDPEYPGASLTIPLVASVAGLAEGRQG